MKEDLAKQPIIISAQQSIRKILRLLLTPDCNSKCFYCHREGMPPDTKSLLTPHDWRFVIEATADLFEGVAIAGGEPMLYADLVSLAEFIFCTTGRAVHLTTNGSLPLNSVVERSNLFARVNLSINTMNPTTYVRITGRPMPKNVLSANLEALSATGIELHTNTVLLPGFNLSAQEISAILDLSKDYNLLPEFLHLIPRTKDEFRATCEGLRRFRSAMAALGYTAELRERPYSHPNTLYRKGSHKVVLRDYGQLTDPETCQGCRLYSFCTEGICHIRLSPDGWLRPCREGLRLSLSILEAIKHRNIDAVSNSAISAQRMFERKLLWKRLCWNRSPEEVN